jgi:signal transduction histidine kinase
MRKLFTPFFTTKREVKGVGLGLAVSYGIIQRHKGKIEVQSKEGEGTTFTIYLPLRHEEREEKG